MPKFDWGAFLENFGGGIGKVAPQMYKDIRAQEITQQHYQDAANLQARELALKENTALYNQGLNTSVPVAPYTPGIGTVANAQIRNLSGEGPLSLNAAEGSYDPTYVPPTAPPTPTLLPSDVPGLAGGMTVPTPAGAAPTAGIAAPGSLEDVRKRISQLDPGDTRGRALLMGQQAQLEASQEKEVVASLHDLNDALKQSREAMIKEEETKKFLAKLEERQKQMTAHLATAGGTPEQVDKLRNDLASTEEQIKLIRTALLRNPAALDVLSVDRSRNARLLSSMGVDPQLIEEYQRAYAAGDSSVGYLGRQILQQAKGRQGGKARK